MAGESTPHGAHARYPIPAEPPRYETGPRRVRESRTFSLYALCDALFIIATVIVTFWFAFLLLREGFSFSEWRLLYLVPLWALCAYLAFPRLHQLFTFLYVPDYFIARTRTGDGLLGDPINLALDGDVSDIHAAMQSAGWILADEITLRSSLGIIRSSVTRKSYPEAPVSSLFLFGRRQEFAYQQEVDGNAAQRHHVRFWPVPAGWKLPGGHEVQWLAAGTYDRSVGLSLFTGQVTHKIDADIDRERDYIINSVRYGDPSVRVDVINEFSTAYHHRNGGGDEVKTDGDLPILNVSGAAARFSGSIQLPTDDAVASTRDRVLPPAALLLPTILVSLVSALLLFAGAMTVIFPEDFTVEDLSEFNNLSYYTVAAAVGMVCAVQTFRRRRWGRIGLMLVGTFYAVLQLSDNLDDPQLTPLTILLTSLMVFALLGLTANSSRQWVSAGRDDVELTVDSSGVQVHSST